MLQSYIFIRYLCKYKAKIIPKCQMMAKVIPCFLPRLVTKKYPAVMLPDIMVSKLYFEQITSVAF